jgi:hypothetical protein
MKVLFWGLSLLVLAFLLHLVVWKIRLPKRQTKIMLLIFFGTLILGSALLWTHPAVSLFGIAAPDGWIEYIRIAFLFTAFTLAYMITYSGLEADSPSLVMVLSIARAGPGGLSRDVFFKQMTDDILIKPRVKDLLTDKMAYLDGETYRLTPKGVLLAKIFVVYRNILGAGKGG